MPNQTSTDIELVAAYLAGDPGAFAAMYDRYGAGLYDTAAAMLRNRHDAADTVQDVFVIAAERLDQLRDPSRLKPWLYAVLRNEVYRRTGKRARTVATDFSEPAAEMSLPSEPASESSDAEYNELTELVRNAAAGLDERDQLVLEYTIRQGLEGDDLAAALGVTPQQSYNLVHRMRQRTERSLGALCVARGGRKDCAELNEILGSWDGTFSVLVRKRVARHIDDCDTCERSRQKFVPLALFGAAPAFAAPPDLRDRVLAAATRGGAAPSYGFTAAGGFPATARHAGRLALWILIATAALLLTTGTTVYMLADDDEAESLAAAPTSSTLALATTTTGATTTSIASTTTSQPAATSTSSTSTSSTSSTSTSSTSSSTTTPVTVTTVVTVLPPAPTTTIRPVVPITAPPVTAPPVPAPPVTAPPITAPPVTAPPITAPPVTAPPATTTTTIAPAPGQLALSSGALDFGSTGTSRTVTLSNPGGLPMNWSTAQGPAGFSGAASPFSVSPSGGTLLPGQSANITVTLSRSRAQTVAGELDSRTITFFAGNVSAPLQVGGTFPPEFDLIEQPTTPDCIRGYNGLYFAIEIFDANAPVQSGPFSPQLVITTPDGQTAADAFGPDGIWYGGVSFSAFPSFPPPGSYGWTITVFDTLGHVSSRSGIVSLVTELC